MQYKIKLSGLYFFGVLLPTSLMFVNGYLADRGRVSWNYTYESLIFKSTLIVSIFFCCVIAIMNHKQQNISFWNTLSVASAIALGLLLFLGYSVSNINLG